MIDKGFLREHSEHRDELDDELRRYELLKGISYYKSPSDIDGMPRGSGGGGDNTADTIIDKYDIETHINQLEKLVIQEEHDIEDVLKLLSVAKQKTVIRIKYFQRYDWDDVALFMFGDRRDCAKNLDKYKSKVQKIHGAALSNLVRLQSEEKNEYTKQISRKKEPDEESTNID